MLGADASISDVMSHVDLMRQLHAASLDAALSTEVTVPTSPVLVPAKEPRARATATAEDVTATGSATETRPTGAIVRAAGLPPAPRRTWPSLPAAPAPLLTSQTAPRTTSATRSCPSGSGRCWDYPHLQKQRHRPYRPLLQALLSHTAVQGPPHSASCRR